MPIDQSAVSLLIEELRSLEQFPKGSFNMPVLLHMALLILYAGGSGGGSQAGVANTPAILTAGGELLAANAGRVLFSVQNHSVNPLFLRLGAGASTTVHHVILPGCGTQDDGTGGYYERSEYTGIVSVAGTGVRCVMTEL